SVSGRTLIRTRRRRLPEGLRRVEYDRQHDCDVPRQALACRLAAGQRPFAVKTTADADTGHEADLVPLEFNGDVQLPGRLRCGFGSVRSAGLGDHRCQGRRVWTCVCRWAADHLDLRWAEMRGAIRPGTAR